MDIPRRADAPPASPLVIFQRLNEEYPNSTTALVYENPLQLLVATILSAQTTDVRVNLTTPALFHRFPDAQAFAEAELEELDAAIRSINFHNAKGRNIKEACRILVADHGGDVPRTMEDLVRLPGVARKTANVVLGNAYGIAIGFVVDTHVRRLSQRLGLTANEDPVKIEQDLMTLFPREQWVLMPHLFIYHGRKVCGARKPLCAACVLNDICPSAGLPPS